MRLSHFLPLLASFILLTAGHALAQLKWEHQIQEFNRVPEDKEIEAQYTFQNTGPAPVTIKSLRSSCGCTTAHLDKRTFAPNETGAIGIHFIFGDRKGYYRKTVTVTTDEKDAAPTVLVLLITIHDPVTIAPELVFWKRGDAPTAQNVQFTVEPSHRVHVKSVTSSNPRLTAKLETTKPGEPYTISVQPADTTQKESAEISVQTDFPADAPHAYTIHARIK